MANTGQGTAASPAHTHVPHDEPNYPHLGKVTMLASASFGQAVTSLQAVAPRNEITVAEVAAPQRLAPHAFALGADATDGETVVASGRLVLLFNPAGESSWQGTMRLVSLITADSDDSNDPEFASVWWQWHIDTLRSSGAQFHALAGGVTQVRTTIFRPEETQRNTVDLELRSSWTPGHPDLRQHVTAWYELLASCGGLPPEGVTMLRPRR